MHQRPVRVVSLRKSNMVIASGGRIKGRDTIREEGQRKVIEDVGGRPSYIPERWLNNLAWWTRLGLQEAVPINPGQAHSAHGQNLGNAWGSGGLPVDTNCRDHGSEYQSLRRGTPTV